jgi:hypothetical protein
MKTKQICIWSAFWKHGYILLKLGVQVGYYRERGMMGNKNRVKKSPNKFKNPKKIHNFFVFCMFQEFWHENEACLYLVCILETWMDSFETWCAD